MSYYPETPNFLRIWILLTVVLVIVFVLNTPKCSAQQVVCDRQPMSGLEYKDNGKRYEASEWHCTGNEQQAFALLSQSGVGPFTPATVDRFAKFTNRDSLRTKFLKGAMYVSTFVGPLAALPGISEVAYKALLGGAPIAAKILTEVAGGLPEDFESAQASGYSVVYAMASGQNRIVQNQPLPTSFSVPTRDIVPEFHPSTWFSLYQDTYSGRKKVIQQWRGADENWKIEERINELQERMNFGEAEIYLARN